MTLVIRAIVEGHGEVAALPVLLRRLVAHLAPGVHVDVPRPHRIGRTSLRSSTNELEDAVTLAALQLRGHRGGVLLLMDADDDCPATLGPSLAARADDVALGELVSIVLPTREFEAWLIAAASSLAGQRGFPESLPDHEDPEALRDAKGWLRHHLPAGRTYSETVDQPALCAIVDLDLARGRSSSFDKLCRELERLLDHHSIDTSDGAV